MSLVQVFDSVVFDAGVFDAATYSPFPPKMAQARSGIARSEYARSNWYIPYLWPVIGGTRYDHALVRDAASGDSTLMIEEVLSSQASICRFDLLDVKPTINAEVQIGYGSPDNVYFGGYVKSWSQKRATRGQSGAGLGTARFVYSVECIGYEWDLEKAYIESETFVATAAGVIARYLIATYAGAAFTVARVQDGPTVPYIYFDHISVADALRKLASDTGYYWDVTPARGVRFFPGVAYASSLAIADGRYSYDEFTWAQDAAQLRNKVYVRGAQSLSDGTTYAVLADGTQRYFTLPYKPVNLSVAVAGASKSVGIDNIDADGTFNYMMNYQESTVRCAAGEPTPAASAAAAFTFQYYKPAVVIVQDPASIAAYGTRESYIEDQTLLDLDTAVMVGEAELTQYSQPIESGTFTTWSQNIFIGDSVAVNLTDRGLNKSVLVQRLNRQVTARRWQCTAYWSTVKLEYLDLIQKVAFLSERQQQNAQANASEIVGTTVNFTP